MRSRRSLHRRLQFEELESRLVLSTVPGADPLPTLISHTSQLNTTVTSTNWSGYGVETSLSRPQSGAVTAVSGSWTVPAVPGTGTGTAYSSIWVGIDGYSSNTVEQIGTDSDIINGKATYYAWYEMYPKWSVTITSLTISPGDSVSASVNYVGNNKFTLQISNDTTGKSFSIDQTARNTKRSSAEWIVEAPSSWTGVLPLANFNKATITNASATINGSTGPIANSPLWQNAAINMVTSSGALKASTSNLDPTTGSSFTVTFVSSGVQSTRNRFFNSPLIPGQDTTVIFIFIVPQTTTNAAPISPILPATPVANPTPAQPAVLGGDSGPLIVPLLGPPVQDAEEDMNAFSGDLVNNSGGLFASDFALTTAHENTSTDATNGVFEQTDMGPSAIVDDTAGTTAPVASEPDPQSLLSDGAVGTVRKAFWLVAALAFFSQGAFVGRTKRNASLRKDESDDVIW